MAAQKGKGHVPPDRTKRYAVVEKPTSGPNQGKVTRVFERDLSWDEALRAKDKIAARRVTKFADLVSMDALAELEATLPVQEPPKKVGALPTPTISANVVGGQVKPISIAPPTGGDFLVDHLNGDDVDIDDDDALDELIDAEIQASANAALDAAMESNATTGIASCLRACYAGTLDEAEAQARIGTGYRVIELRPATSANGVATEVIFEPAATGDGAPNGGAKASS